MLVRPTRAAALAPALLLLVAGCGHSLVPTASVAPSIQSALQPAKSAPIVVKPTKLAFTTKKNLTLTITETGYTGTFKIADSKPKVAKASSSAKGPRASLKVTAVSAGSGTLTIRDSHGQVKKVSFGVTTGVVIIQ